MSKERRRERLDQILAKAQSARKVLDGVRRPGRVAQSPADPAKEEEELGLILVVGDGDQDGMLTPSATVAAAEDEIEDLAPAPAFEPASDEGQDLAPIQEAFSPSAPEPVLAEDAQVDLGEDVEQAGGAVAEMPMDGIDAEEEQGGSPPEDAIPPTDSVRPSFEEPVAPVPEGSGLVVETSPADGSSHSVEELDIVSQQPAGVAGEQDHSVSPSLSLLEDDAPAHTNFLESVELRARQERERAEMLDRQLREQARKREEFEENAEQDNGPVDDIQEDVLPIVLEEAQEDLVPDIERLLSGLTAGDRSVLSELHRKVHTLKGSLAMVGAARARTLMHSMETWMEQAEAGEVDPGEGHERLRSLFDNVKDKIAALARGDHRMAPAPAPPGEAGPSRAAPGAPVVTSRRVHIKSEDVDRYITEINEARLANVSLSSQGVRVRNMLMDLEEKGQRLYRLLRELEIHADTQIQSRKTQLEESGEEFDPLEFDRYTRLQEISRFLGEGVGDVMDIQREMATQLSEQETLVAYQGRAIEGVQDGLQRTRLIPADALADRLHKVVWAASKESGKSSNFFLEGGRQALDRILLEKIASPLEHILRNAVAHGIESPQERKDAGKPAAGSINMALRQEAGRVHIVVSDDGRGLDPEKIRQKAVEKGLWNATRPMSMSEAADVICMEKFSTADAVSELAGRGVGMDVVRSEVMAMGGRFEIHSQTGRGMSISIVLPTAIASISVVLVEAGGETWAIPVEMVEHMDKIPREQVQSALENGSTLTWGIGQEEVNMKCRPLSELMGLPFEGASAGSSMLILRSGDQRAAVFVDALVGVAELPMRSLGRQWSSVPGVMGATILPDGRAGFLIDPLRANWVGVVARQDLPEHRAKPVVLVVDDSITVRKVTARFLERNNYDAILAKDGQEAVEMLVDLVPDAILLDVEMPRMDGFDCARHIRENPKVSHVPIVMITSRTADKHRQRAVEMGVNAYLGKPFKEEELLPLLEKFTRSISS